MARRLLLLAFSLLPIFGWGANTTLTGETYDTSGGVVYVGIQPPIDPEQPIQITSGKFIDSAASNGGSGSLASPWNEISDITGMTTGEDIWFKAGSSFSTGSERILDVTWEGSASNQSIIGCYYVSGGLAYQCTSAQTKPVFNGDYTTACVNTSLSACSLTVNSRFSEFFRIKDRSYVTIQSVKIQNAPGRAIVFDTSLAADIQTHNKIINVDMYHIGAAAVTMRRSQNIVFKGNTVNGAGMCFQYDALTSTGEYACRTAGGGRTRPGATAFNMDFAPDNEQNIDGLVQGNVIENGRAECINIQSGLIVRDNICGNLESEDYYVKGSDVVVENNIQLGPYDIDGFNQDFVNVNNTKDGFGTIHGEDEGEPALNRRIMFRNNATIAPINSCFSFKNFDSTPTANELSGWVLGNTCIADGDNGNSLHNVVNSTALNTAEGFYFANNIFYSTDTVTLCDSGWLSQYIMGPNLFTPGYALGNCATDGAADVRADPQTATSYANLKAILSTTNPSANVSFADVALQEGSPAIAAGANWATTDCIDTSKFTYAFSQMDTSLTISQWGKCLYADANEQARPSPPSLGAVEYNATPTASGIFYAAAPALNISETSIAATQVQVGASSDDLVVCSASLEDAAIPAPGTLGDATINGVAMTALTAETSGTKQVRFYYALNSQLPASSGTYNAQVQIANDVAGLGGLAFSCVAYQTHQKAPRLVGTSGTGGTALTVGAFSVSAGDYLQAATALSSGNRTHTFSPGTWEELHDLTKTTNNDFSTAAAYQEILADGSVAVTATLNTAESFDWVLGAVHVEAPYSAGSPLSTGFCANDGITNSAATYTITGETLIDSQDEFSYFDNCGFTLTAGPTAGDRSFTYRLNDYDGNGTNASYTVTVTVN